MESRVLSHRRTGAKKRESHDRENDTCQCFECVFVNEGDEEYAKEGDKKDVGSAIVGCGRKTRLPIPSEHTGNGTNEEEGYQSKAKDAKGYEEVEILVVGVQLGVGERRICLSQHLVARVGDIASTHPHQRMAKKHLPSCIPQFEPLEKREIAHIVVATVILKLVEEYIKQFAGTWFEIYRIGNTFFYGSHIRRGEDFYRRVH